MTRLTNRYIIQSFIAILATLVIGMLLGAAIMWTLQTESGGRAYAATDRCQALGERMANHGLIGDGRVPGLPPLTDVQGGEATRYSSDTYDIALDYHNECNRRSYEETLQHIKIIQQRQIIELLRGVGGH